MSYSLDQTEHQAADIRNYVRGFSPTTDVVLETNKRSVVQCAHKHEAQNLAYNLRGMGYSTGIKKGLKSEYWYVQVTFNLY